MPGLVTTLLDRHAGGDFGDLCEEDRAANAAGVAHRRTASECLRGREPVVVHHHRGGSVADDDPAAGGVLMGTRRLLEMLVGIADAVPGLIAATALILCEPDANPAFPL